jgi:hypothetical protein
MARKGAATLRESDGAAMKATLYIDKGRPLASVVPERLSDGSTAWNLHIRGERGPYEVIPCQTEKAADHAFRLIAEALKVATGEEPLIL